MYDRAEQEAVIRNLQGDPSMIAGFAADVWSKKHMDPDVIEAVFKACNAFWFYSGDPTHPHAELHSGKCSNGFINCPMVLCHSNLCQIMAGQMVRCLRQSYKDSVDWVVGSATAAQGLSKDMANILGAKWHPLQKGPDKTQVWEKMVIKADERVLHIEELMTTETTALAVRAGIRKAHDHPIEFIPFLPVLMHRPVEGKGKVVDGSKVIYVCHYDIWAVEQPECDLCRKGSERLTPKGPNWAKLTGKE